MSWVFLFLLGLCVGSFLNCWVYRLNHGLSVMRGRSFCPKCRHQLAWRDNIPLLSFLFLRGRCRCCHSPIASYYPLVELAAGLLTILISQLSNYELLITGYYLLIAYALLAIFVSDWLYQTIPDQFVYPAIILTGFYLLITNYGLLITNLFSGLAAAGFFGALVWLTKGKGMGLGDVKLAGSMGLILGWPRIALAIILAFLTGAIVGVILVLLNKKTMRSQIAFGPFLIAATFISLFWGEKIIKIWGY